MAQVNRHHPGTSVGGTVPRFALSSGMGDALQRLKSMEFDNGCRPPTGGR
jgi:hypothetical protein